MSRHEGISDDQLREELVSFARLILLLERKGALLDRSASLLRLLGELRRMVFAYEVRVTDRSGPPRPRRPGAREAGSAPDAPADHPSDRIVRDARARARELLRELGEESLDDESMDDEHLGDGP